MSIEMTLAERNNEIPTSHRRNDCVEYPLLLYVDDPTAIWGFVEGKWRPITRKYATKTQESTENRIVEVKYIFKGHDRDYPVSPQDIIEASATRDALEEISRDMYRLYTASTSEEAIQKIRTTPPYILLLSSSIKDAERNDGNGKKTEEIGNKTPAETVLDFVVEEVMEKGRRDMYIGVLLEPGTYPEWLKVWQATHPKYIWRVFERNPPKILKAELNIVSMSYPYSIQQAKY